MMRPAPGRVVLKPIETSETLAGGRILLTETVREAWTLGQAEVVLVGDPAVCEDEDCEREHARWRQWRDGQEYAQLYHLLDERLKPGAWVLCKARRFVELPDGNWLVNALDIVGIFATDATAPSGQTPT